MLFRSRCSSFREERGGPICWDGPSALRWVSEISEDPGKGRTMTKNLGGRLPFFSCRRRPSRSFFLVSLSRRFSPRSASPNVVLYDVRAPEAGTSAPGIAAPSASLRASSSSDESTSIAACKSVRVEPGASPPKVSRTVTSLRVAEISFRSGTGEGRDALRARQESPEVEAPWDPGRRLCSQPVIIRPDNRCLLHHLILLGRHFRRRPLGRRVDRLRRHRVDPPGFEAADFGFKRDRKSVV